MAKVSINYCMQVQENLIFKYRSDKLQLMENLFKKCESYFKEANLSKAEITDLNALFIKWMYSCFIDLNNSSCDLRFTEKIKYIKSSVKKYKYIIDNTINLSFILRILKLAFISPIMVLLISKCIYLIKVKFREIFYK